MTKTTIYSARKIITMNLRQPEASHVAVRDGWILGAGGFEELTGWGAYELDDQFADKVLMPGFVEGHCHSWEGSAWKDPYLGFYDRMAPDRVTHQGCKSIDDVVSRLAGFPREPDAANESLMGWGLDPIFLERRMTASDLDRVSTERPVIVMHQSGHIINVNSHLLQLAKIDKNTNVQGLVRDANGEPTGELQGPALRDIAYRAAGRNRFLDMGDAQSLWRFGRSAQLAGVTTATDLANELPEETVASQIKATSNPGYPLRIVPAFVAHVAFG